MAKPLVLVGVRRPTLLRLCRWAPSCEVPTAVVVVGAFRKSSIMKLPASLVMSKLKDTLLVTLTLGWPGGSTRSKVKVVPPAPAPLTTLFFCVVFVFCVFFLLLFFLVL